MYISRSVLLLLLTAYIFSPTILSWMIYPNGIWYRPYLIWAALVLAAALLQWGKHRIDDEV